LTSYRVAPRNSGSSVHCKRFRRRRLDLADAAAMSRRFDEIRSFVFQYRRRSLTSPRSPGNAKERNSALGRNLSGGPGRNTRSRLPSPSPARRRYLMPCNTQNLTMETRCYRPTRCSELGEDQRPYASWQRQAPFRVQAPGFDLGKFADELPIPAVQTVEDSLVRFVGSRRNTPENARPYKTTWRTHSPPRVRKAITAHESHFRAASTASASARPARRVCAIT